MDSEMVKGKLLTKEETKFLLELIEGSQIITTKTTNATNNKLKTEEWIRLTERFNATATNSPRTWQQLRLKWENLKKNAFGDARVSLVEINEEPFSSIPMSIDNNIEIDNGIENVVTNYKVLNVVDQNVMTPTNTKRFTFGTPRAVKKKIKPYESRMARNNAIAEYFTSKKQCLEAKVNNIHLENENLKLKNLQLSLKNDKLVIETEKLKLELKKLKESL